MTKRYKHIIVDACFVSKLYTFQKNCDLLETLSLFGEELITDYHQFSRTNCDFCREKEGYKDLRNRLTDEEFYQTAQKIPARDVYGDFQIDFESQDLVDYYIVIVAFALKRETAVFSADKNVMRILAGNRVSEDSRKSDWGDGKKIDRYCPKSYLTFLVKEGLLLEAEIVWPVNNDPFLDKEKTEFCQKFCYPQIGCAHMPFKNI